MQKIVFFGSSPFSCVVLEKIAPYCVAVVTNPDKPAGRHLKLTPNPVKVMAEKLGISVQYSMSNIQLESGTIGLVAAYGKIIPQEILDKFNGQMYNIHPSLLPKYRGPSPLQQQILDGVVETGVTIIKMDDKMDHGPIIGTVFDTILPTDTTVSLGNRLFSLGADAILNSQFSILNQIPIPQNHNNATFTKKLTRESGFIEYERYKKCLDLGVWDLDIARMQRAFVGWPGTWTIDSKGERIKLS